MKEGQPGKDSRQEVVMKGNLRLEEGETLRVGTLMKSEVFVPDGACLVIEQAAMKSTITIEKGGVVEWAPGAVNSGTEIINSNAAEDSSEEKVVCEKCGGVVPKGNFCATCGNPLKALAE